MDNDEYRSKRLHVVGIEGLVIAGLVHKVRECV